ncbi:MAG: methylated-DNA--[protein]-cysteine S-methyltransferase [Ruthenibacterium lactatiformans]
MARQIGRPAACRAVGRANGRNPLSIFVPCHRVIGASGQLTDMGGLDKERSTAAPGRSFALTIPPEGASERTVLFSQDGPC